MSGYILFDATAGNYVEAIVTDVDGEDQFDLRAEMRHDAVEDDRLFSESNGVLVLAIDANDYVRASAYDGTDRVFTSSAAPPETADWYQIRAVMDLTSNPLTCDFYTRVPGADLSNNDDWVALGAQQTIATTFSGVTLFTNGAWSIGGRGGEWHGGVRQAYCLYGAGDTVFTDIDLRELTAGEIAAAEFVGDDGLTWSIAGAAWEYVNDSVVETVIRPISDTAGTGWDSAPVGSQDLYLQVDEAVTSDTDYIFTEDPNP